MRTHSSLPPIVLEYECFTLLLETKSRSIHLKRITDFQARQFHLSDDTAVMSYQIHVESEIDMTSRLYLPRTCVFAVF